MLATIRTTPGGVNKYVEWSSGASIPEHFFTDEECREHFKRNALNLISRTNSFNGRRYRDDPTIFSWVRGADRQEQRAFEPRFTLSVLRN